MKEIWKDIPNYEGRYQVSNHGRVYSLNQRKTLMKPSISNYGYHRIGLYKNNVRTFKFIHRLVAQTFIPNPNNLPEVNHLDGVKTNNKVNNLEWSTKSNNEKHAFRTGLKISCKGIKHPKSKLTEQQVLEIRNKYMPRKYSLTMLANEYNISFQLVSLIINRKIWTHI